MQLLDYGLQIINTVTLSYENETEVNVMIFSEKLQILRKSKGFTQEELSEKLNVSRQAVAKWESGQARLDSHDFRYEKGDFTYHDTYVGGEQFAGEEAIWEKGKAIYAMNYAGRVLDEKFSGNFLKEALRAAKEDMPYRGPAYYQSGEYLYQSKVTGGINWFQGYEEIYCNNKKVYECYFHGGLMK